MKTLIIDKKEYSKVVDSLNKGDIVSFPTETVMGLAVDAFNEESYHKLIEIKNRPLNKAFPFVVGNINDIEKYAYVNDKIKKVIKCFLPGPLTIVLNKKDNVPSFVTSQKNTIAIRIPDDQTVLNILKDFGKPILLTSANKSGEPCALTSLECYNIFNGQIEYIIEGECKINEASTIVDLTGDDINIIREGKIQYEEIKKIWGE